MSILYLSETAGLPLLRWLRKEGHLLRPVRKTTLTYDPVSSHADIYMCSLGPGKPVYFGDPQKLGPRYPHNIRFNAACTGKFFIHNLKYTDPDLLAFSTNAGLVPIQVPQGYSKCNLVIVDQTSVITSDPGIYNACAEHMDVLLIEKGHVRLPGFPYGFLGGASGRVGNTILFNGDLKQHPDHRQIAGFLTRRGLKIKDFPEYPLEDIGSIIEDPTLPFCY